MNRKAVIIWGTDNSGKTSTIKHLVGCPKRLNNRIFKISNIKKKEVEVFVLGQSPSEKRQTLEELIKKNYKKEALPDKIIVAEQINGKNAGNTINFLIKNKYKITFFVINNPEKYNRTHWDYNTDSIPSETVFLKRVEDIKAIF